MSQSSNDLAGHFMKLIAILLIVFVMLFIHINNGLAEPVNQLPSDKEEIQHRTRQEAEERRNREQAGDVFLQHGEKQLEDTTLPTEKISFVINTLQLQGERVDEFCWAQEMLNKYAGQKIGKEGINVLVKRLTHALISRGYVTTRISVPEQDLSSGTLKLTLIPGIIRNIGSADSTTYVNWVTAFPTRPGKILNLRDLEQGLEQIKRVPSQDATLQIVPGQKPGESDVVISVRKGNPFRTFLSLDDSGSKATGKLQASASLSLDNLLGSNDLLYISFNKDAEQKNYLYGTHGYNYQYSLPYGYWTFTIAGSFYDYHQTQQGRNAVIRYSGKSDSNEFRIERLIYRGQQNKTSLQFRIIKQHSRNFVEDTELIPQRKDVSADEVSLIHRHYYGKTVVDIDLAHRWGVPWFHAQADENQGPDEPTTRYKLWTLDATVTTPVQIGKMAGKYSCNLRAQSTKDLLYNTDYFSIGNRYTVRGFDGEQTLCAEKGWLIRNELSAAVAAGEEVYIGFDYGQVSGPGTQWLLGNKLAGAVLGIRGKVAGIYYDVFTSWPVYKPQGYQTSSYSLGFQLTYQL